MNRILVAFDYFAPTFPLVNNNLNFNSPLDKLRIDNGTYEFFNKVGGYDCVPTLTLNDNDLFYFYKGVVQCYGEAMAKWKQEQIIDFLQSEITERRDYTASKMCEKAIEFIKKFKNK